MPASARTMATVVRQRRRPPRARPAPSLSTPPGNLYFADSGIGAARVRKVSVSQTVSTIAGGQTAFSATNDGQALHAFLSNLAGLAVDAAGNIYVAGNAKVQKVTQAGAISTFAGV